MAEIINIDKATQTFSRFAVQMKEAIETKGFTYTGALQESFDIEFMENGYVISCLDYISHLIKGYRGKVNVSDIELWVRNKLQLPDASDKQIKAFAKFLAYKIETFGDAVFIGDRVGIEEEFNAAFDVVVKDVSEQLADGMVASVLETVNYREVNI